MAGKPQYTDAEILWFVKQVYEYKIKNEDRVCAAFQQRFGRQLKAHQYKYLKGRYGKDAGYNCPASTGIASLVRPATSQEAHLPILPIGQDYATMPSQTEAGHGNVGPNLNLSQTMEGRGNVDPSLNSSQTMEGYGNVGPSLNSSQTIEGYGNVDPSLNNGSSFMAEANHYMTAGHRAANNIPRQTTPAPVPSPWQAGLSGSSRMYTASRTPRSERRRRTARAAAHQRAQTAVHADEQIERQLQNRQQVHDTQRMQGIPQPQYHSNQIPMLWSQDHVSPSMQQAHFGHGMHQVPGYAHQEMFAGGQANWTMNPYSGHQPPVVDYRQQATYMGNGGQEIPTQPWIGTQENHLQGRQSAAPVTYMGNHGQEISTQPWIGTQENHLQGMEYPRPAAPETVFSAPEQGYWEATHQLGVPDSAPVIETEENRRETGQGMQNLYERNGEPDPSSTPSHGQSYQSMPLSRGESQQSIPLSYEQSQQSMPSSRGESQQSEPFSHGESQQSMPLFGDGLAASGTLQESTSVNHISLERYKVISVLHLQKLLHGGASNVGTSNGTENVEEKIGEVADIYLTDPLNPKTALSEFEYTVELPA